MASAGGDDSDDGVQTLAFHSEYGKSVEYAFEATGDVTVLDHAPHLDVPDHKVSRDRGSTIMDSHAAGLVNGGYDVFAYEGDLVAFEITDGDCDDLELWDTGTPVDPCALAAKLSGSGKPPSCEPEVIDSCRKIEDSGYYVLDGDIDGSGDYATKNSDGRKICIEIAADDVVLDGRGHAITGSEDDADLGLRVTGDDVVVRDVDVVEWGICVHLLGDRTTLYGAKIDNLPRPDYARLVGLRVEGTGCTIHDVEVSAGYVGVNLLEATDAVLSDSSIFGIEEAIVLERTTGCTVRNTGSGTTYNEGLVVSESEDSLFVDNEFTGEAIAVSVGKCEGTVFRANTIDASLDSALAITNSAEVVLVANDVSDSNAGIYLEEVTDSVLQGNLANDTDDVGIEVVRGSNNVLTGNETWRNEEAGIELTETVENVLAANTVRENSATAQDGGIHLVDADRNTIVRNTVCDNDGPSEIFVDGSSSNNQISNNDTSC